MQNTLGEFRGRVAIDNTDLIYNTYKPLINFIGSFFLFGPARPIFAEAHVQSHTTAGSIQ